jgi:hypothetical protein
MLYNRAKLAYDAWAQAPGIHRGFNYPAFPDLPPAFIEAWKNVVVALDAEPTCPQCGSTRMTCEKCREQTS